MLSNHFGFNINDARALIGLPVTSKICTVSKIGSTQKKCDTQPKRRAKSGYNLYYDDAKCRVESNLKSLNGGAKLARGQLVSEMSKRWKQLPESTREMWNQRAAGA